MRRVPKARGATGLGLAIVQSIVQLHGGHVQIRSQPGQGTRVTLHVSVWCAN
ncbi:MAG TPA: ATP-binding protein [Gemmataceae bacterium]|nr:ATP-binding protein [Gemmataceae bacterium]